MSEISEIEDILRNEKLPGYLKASAETAKGIIKFFTWLSRHYHQRKLSGSKTLLQLPFSNFLHDF